MQSQNSSLRHEPSPGTKEFDDMLNLNNPQIRYYIKAASPQNEDASVGSDGKMSPNAYDVYYISTDPNGASTLDSLMWLEGKLALAMPRIVLEVGSRVADTHTSASASASSIRSGVETLLPEDFSPSDRHWRKWDSSLSPGSDGNKTEMQLDKDSGDTCWVSRMTLDFGEVEFTVKDKEGIDRVVRRKGWHILLGPPRRVDEGAGSARTEASPIRQVSSESTHVVTTPAQSSGQDSGYWEDVNKDLPDLPGFQGDECLDWMGLGVLRLSAEPADILMSD